MGKSKRKWETWTCWRGGGEGWSEMPVSAVKPIWALCRECVCTCANWCAFAQSALTPFKVTVSWDEHPRGDQCPANTLHLHHLPCLSPVLSAPPLTFQLPLLFSFYPIHLLMNQETQKLPCPCCTPAPLFESHLFWLPTRMSTVPFTFCSPLSVNLQAQKCFL